VSFVPIAIGKVVRLVDVGIQRLDMFLEKFGMRKVSIIDLETSGRGEPQAAVILAISQDDAVQ
jgi:hypothetical protein